MQNPITRFNYLKLTVINFDLMSDDLTFARQLPETGECVDEYDFKDLWPKQERKHDHADVLNGVSVSGEDGVLYVTGKLWKKMFRLKLK